MRLFAIGDIHGCAQAFEALVDAIHLQPGDRLVTLGDYCNKGRNTKAVLEYLIELYRQGVLIPLRGNHEIKLLRALELQRSYEADRVLVDRFTLQSYSDSGWPGSLSDIPDAHVRFIREHCRDYYETNSHIFVHATVAPSIPLHEQLSEFLFWKKMSKPHPHYSGKTVICGHTPQKNGRPLNLGHVICLDTAIADGQWLTCLEVKSGQVWQANQAGKLRMSWIEEDQKQLVGLY